MTLSDSLRAQLRANRRSVSRMARAAASRCVARLATHELHLRPGLRVALYRALPEELDTAPLIARCQARGCRLYFPRITDYRSSRMRFFESTDGGRINRYGIAEPSALHASVPLRELDLVFVPLVGFDEFGTRLGMGKGYYDRTFAFRRLRSAWHRPQLIGLAFDIQRVPRLVRAAHDVQLDGVITELGYRKCSTG